jgi:hypothetical protein
MVRHNGRFQAKVPNEKSLSRFHPRLEMLESRLLLKAGDLDPSFGTGGIVTTAIRGLDRAHSLALTRGLRCTDACGRGWRATTANRFACST